MVVKGVVPATVSGDAFKDDVVTRRAVVSKEPRFWGHSYSTWKLIGHKLPLCRLANYIFRFVLSSLLSIVFLNYFSRNFSALFRNLSTSFLPQSLSPLYVCPLYLLIVFISCEFFDRCNVVGSQHFWGKRQREAMSWCTYMLCSNDESFSLL